MSMKTIERPAVSDEAVLPLRNMGMWIVMAAALSLLIGGLVLAIVRSPAEEQPMAAEIGWSPEAQSAEAARWAARAEMYARVRAQQAETDRLTGQALAAGLTPAQLTEADRWIARGEAYRAERAMDAWTDRLTGLAVYQLPSLFNRAEQAEADRLTGQALVAGLTPAQLAEADRWIARGEAYQSQRALDAWADRLTGLAEHMGR